MEERDIPSFQKFDYRIRMNKSAERRMLCEAFRCLSFFGPVEKYRYVGFGSTTFRDFIIFHKTLNIQDMISIEKRKEYERRFEFNKPFHCVKVKYGESSEILPQLKWDKRVIVWLDYEGRLDGSMLADLSFVSSKARSGSMLISTVNVEPTRVPRKMNYKKTERILLEKFGKELEPEPLPQGISGKNLEGEELARTYRAVMMAYIRQALTNRNGLSLPENRMEYRPLFNILYADGARMLTIGGVLFEEKDKDALARCRFESLSFVNVTDDKPYKIKIPAITPRERHYLDQRLPKGASKDALNIGLTKDQIEDYVRLYRYCPSFAEIELS